MLEVGKSYSVREVFSSRKCNVVIFKKGRELYDVFSCDGSMMGRVSEDDVVRVIEERGYVTYCSLSKKEREENEDGD